jgi:hypothetical protein
MVTQTPVLPSAAFSDTDASKATVFLQISTPVLPSYVLPTIDALMEDAYLAQMISVLEFDVALTLCAEMGNVCHPKMIQMILLVQLSHVWLALAVKMDSAFPMN